MGNILQSIEDAIFTRPPTKQFLVLGLDGAGKSTILYQLNSKTVINSPTIGFNTEMVTFQNYNVVAFDINIHRPKFFHLFCKHHFDNAKGTKNSKYKTLYYFEGLIFVLDKTDISENWKNASDALDQILAEDSLKGAPLLILLNKVDLMKSSLVEEAIIKLNMEEIGKERPLKILESCAYNMSGVLEGIEWIINLDNKNKEFLSIF